MVSKENGHLHHQRLSPTANTHHRKDGNHLIASIDESTNLIFIDLHLVHEVTSPQAFDSLRLSDRKVKHPELTLATVDHGVPTSNRLLGIKDPLSKIQIEA